MYTYVGTKYVIGTHNTRFFSNERRVENNIGFARIFDTEKDAFVAMQYNMIIFPMNEYEGWHVIPVHINMVSTEKGVR